VFPRSAQLLPYPEEWGLIELGQFPEGIDKVEEAVEDVHGGEVKGLDGRVCFIDECPAG
jgi:hypothetical protein